MQASYLHRNVSSNCTDILDLKSVFKDFSQTVQSLYPKYKKNSDDYIKSYLGVDDSEYDELKSTFDLRKYSWTNVPVNKMVVPVKGFKPNFKLYDIPEEPKLKSLRHLKSLQSKKQTNLKKLVKYHGEVLNDDIPVVTEINKVRIKEFTDYLLTVRVYLPTINSPMKNRSYNFQVSQELLVCGNICLDTLRDRILCQEDYTPADGDISENPFAPTTVLNKDLFRSAMFYIDMFYIDGRDPRNIDYSEVIKDWATMKKVDLGATKLMENTKFNSIKLRLGYPYLFMHQGYCEHIIIFTDARLIGPKDLLFVSAYPLMKSYSSSKGKKCLTCAKQHARFIVIGMERLPVKKAYMCPYCLFQYGYIDGKKVENFTVYKYVHRAALF